MTDARFAPTGGNEQVDPDAERIVAEIEVTRTQMEGTIEEIGHRLQPQTIASQAREQIREATVGKVERMVDEAGRTAQQTGNDLVDTIRQNPVPAALAALGIGWLAMRMRGQQSSSGYGGHYGGGTYAYDQGYRTGFRGDMDAAYQPRSGDPLSGVREGADRARSGVQDAADQARSGVQDAADEAAYRARQVGDDIQTAAQDALDRTHQTVQQAQWQAQGVVDDAQRQFDRTLQENPLALGALAVGVGAAVALAIPETQKERELMGEQRDRLLTEAQSAASKVLEQTQQQAEEVGQQLRDQG